MMTTRGTSENGVFHEWELVEEGLVLTLTTTDEGIILDVFDANREESIYTEAMMVDEWIDWMRQRDIERTKKGD
jgi:hypothetical protein